MARSLVQNGLASQLCRVASALFFLFYHRSLSTCSSEKKGGKKISKNKKKGFFFRSTLKFSIILHRIKYHFFIVLVYNARRWIDVCVYNVCFVWLFFGTFALLVQQISSSNGGIVGISIE